MRIETMYPNTQWTRVWKNLHEVWTTDAIRAAWYKVIHDIVPTNVRHAKIKRSDTDRCRLCGRSDTLIHRLTECMEMKYIWVWTRRRIGLMLHTDPTNIPRNGQLCQVSKWGPHRKEEHYYGY
jgi:hypothetical protein